MAGVREAALVAEIAVRIAVTACHGRITKITKVTKITKKQLVFFCSHFVNFVAFVIFVMDRQHESG